jgi:hypothetical protein
MRWIAPRTMRHSFCARPRRSHPAIQHDSDSGVRVQGAPVDKSAKAPLGQARKKSWAEMTRRSRTGARAAKTDGERICDHPCKW